MPDPRTREGMPDLYAYAHLLAEEKRRRPGDDVMSVLLAQSGDEETLGEHQDSVVARQIIRELAVAAAGAGENGFTFGLLHAYEENIAESTQRTYRSALRSAANKRVRRWLRQ